MGTPISNSVTEAYIMNKYLDPYGLAEKDMRSFDAWAANFAQRVTKLEFAPTGKGFRQKTRISKFDNLPELMQMFKKFTDIKMAEDLNLPEPECERHIVKAERSEIQAQLMESLSERAEKIHNKQVTPDQDNMLLITSDGTKIGLDPRLIDPLLPDFEGSKVNLCVNNVLDIYNSTSANKLTQVIFCDYSTPKPNGEFSVYKDIKEKLVSKGIPENEIAFIHDCKNDKQKQQLFDKVKSGDVRVIIGSTQKMGAGTNIQDRLYAMHHLDAPWKPRDLSQRLGRMKRQGNMNEKVHEYIYITEDSFDAYRFQTLENKQGYISQIMSNSNPLRSCEDVSSEEMGYAAVKAACVGNPLIKEKMELDIAVNELQVLKKGFMNSRYKLEDDVKVKLPKVISNLSKSYTNSLTDIETAKRFPKRVDDEGKQHFYGLILNGKRYTDKEQVGTELINAASKVLVGNLSKRMKIGEYKGFQLEAYFDVLSQKTKIDICGRNKYTIEVGESADGNIQRMDNKINAIPEISNDFRIQHDNAVKQLEDAKAQLAVPFPQEQELAEKQARLDFLNAELSKENEDKLLGKDNDKSFEIATEAEKKEAEEREKARVQKELDGDFDLSEM